MLDDELKTRRQREKERLVALHLKCPTDDKNFPYTGVLLGDAIEYCVDTFDLIRPFHKENLKPANYKLTIGDECAISGKIRRLSDQTGQDELTIEPFQVAIIMTRETINMPCFLIGRWNIRVQLAYKGLLWVGGPQVDAGYVGHLFCPVYNLSDKKVVLHYADPIAVIDFVRTSLFIKDKSPEYKPIPPERLLIEDYEATELQSALYTQAVSRLDKSDTRMDGLQQRVDGFISLTFAVVAILFAAISFSLLGKSPPWPYISIFLLSGSAIFLAASAWLKSTSEGRLFGRSIQVIIVIGLAVAFLCQMFWIRSQRKQIEELGKEIHELKKTQSILIGAPTKTVMPPAQGQAPDNKKASPDKTNP